MTTTLTFRYTVVEGDRTDAFDILDTRTTNRQKFSTALVRVPAAEVPLPRLCYSLSSSPEHGQTESKPICSPHNPPNHELLRLTFASETRRVDHASGRSVEDELALRVATPKVEPASWGNAKQRPYVPDLSILICTHAATKSSDKGCLGQAHRRRPLVPARSRRRRHRFLRQEHRPGHGGPVRPLGGGHHRRRRLRDRRHDWPCLRLLAARCRGRGGPGHAIYRPEPGEVGQERPGGVLRGQRDGRI